MNGYSQWLAFGCRLLLSLAAVPIAAAPVVVGFSPAAGAPGVQVTVRGAGFSTATKVQFDAVLADFSVANDGQLIAVVPPAATTGRIWVTNPTGAGSSSIEFTVSPRISGFFPGRSGPTMAVTIDGFNFNGATHVQFHGSNANFTVTAPTQICAIVPDGAASGLIQVRTPAGTAVSPTAFVVTGPEPIIDSFSQDYAAPGAEIIICGINFANVTAVRFNGVAAYYTPPPASTQLHAVVPADATTGRVTVTTPSGTATSPANLVVTRAPVITGFFPGIGKAGQTTVTIYGINFSSLTGVGFNGRPVTAFSTPAPNQIFVTVPSGATTGPISVTNIHGYGASAGSFVVTTAPIVDRFDPWLGSPGTTVAVIGENFTGVTAVRFNGVPAAYAPPPASTQLYAVVPADATAGPITVANFSGSFTTPSNFVVTPSFPFMTRMTPGHGPRGTEVNLYGVNFSAAPIVRFNGATDPTAYLAGQVGREYNIKATVPAAATTGPISITTGMGTSTNAAIFYVPPRLASFVPTNGVAGDTVLLRGTNFDGATDVLFSQERAAFTVSDAGHITAQVPTNATTGPLTVVTPGGVITSTNTFRVRPTIWGFSPAQGPTGTVVNVVGASLNGVVGVYFNGTPAAFTNRSAGEISATVPTNATTGPIEIRTTNDAAVSLTPFLVTGPGDGRLSLLAFPVSAQPGETNVFTWVASNGGPWTITQVRIHCQLPTNFAYLAAATTQGGCAPSNGVVICDLGYLTNGARAVVTLTGRFEAEGWALVDGMLSASEPDGYPLNNHTVAMSTVASNTTRTLTVTRPGGGSEVLLSWPVSPVNFRLQWSLDPANPDSWSPDTNAPTVLSGRNYVRSTMSGHARFYRLLSP